MRTERGLHRTSKDREPITPFPDRAAKVVAQSIFRNMTESGCSARDLINVAAELLALTTQALVDEKQPIESRKAS